MKVQEGSVRVLKVQEGFVSMAESLGRLSKVSPNFYFFKIEMTFKIIILLKFDSNLS